ncbi:MAG: hypothetical protein A3F82_03000 [Deltaproteobacteria bacterium RIFCSPLOWO2_12_FULL_44_12]|nr:MAG: hypothetical protein A3D98_06550 [Deltaproteobacteria bacterium RIFCSPHIGHO2_12_FULL_44_21]OGQ69549.1 MAG: hypothetical protein A3F82_03000 [Deltaproteobacteria bacterium RIFCSPLOWO2_12_FULL_44_12]
MNTKKTILVLIICAVAGTVLAQAWEASDKSGGQVRFDRRDEKGLLYFGLRWVFEDGRQGHPTTNHAADCAKRVLYDWDDSGQRWENEGMVGDGLDDIAPNSTFGGALTYICRKYGTPRTKKNKLR